MTQSILILLAEDEPLIALELKAALEDAGFDVRHAQSGEDAIRTLDEGADRISGLITDIKLGGEVTGWDLARHARELDPHTPIVYMSGDSAHEHPVNGVPGSVMIQKPFANAQVITAISTLLNAAPPPEPT